jgi:hypothetical protein
MEQANASFQLQYAVHYMYTIQLFAATTTRVGTKKPFDLTLKRKF